VKAVCELHVHGWGCKRKRSRKGQVFGLDLDARCARARDGWELPDPCREVRLFFVAPAGALGLLGLSNPL
jgi:hypothetical protein